MEQPFGGPEAQTTPSGPGGGGGVQKQEEDLQQQKQKHEEDFQQSQRQEGFKNQILNRVFDQQARTWRNKSENPSCEPAGTCCTSDGQAESVIYVNAKQYRRIMIRRNARQRLIDTGRIEDVPSRKKYLHETRHIHAVRRVRGLNGRFMGND